MYSDKKSSNEKILEKDWSIFIHHRNIHTLKTKMFKVRDDRRPEITGNIFIERTSCSYNLRYWRGIITPLVKIVYCGTETLFLNKLRKKHIKTVFKNQLENEYQQIICIDFSNFY